LPNKAVLLLTPARAKQEKDKNNKGFSEKKRIPNLYELVNFAKAPYQPLQSLFAKTPIKGESGLGKIKERGTLYNIKREGLA